MELLTKEYIKELKLHGNGTLATLANERMGNSGDLVFDPFSGSGTLGRTAQKLDRRFFLTEKETEYFQYMQTLYSQDNIFEQNAHSCR